MLRTPVGLPSGTPSAPSSELDEGAAASRASSISAAPSIAASAATKP